MSKNYDINIENKEKIERGKRIKFIRENELKLNKTDLAKQIGISSQFLGLVESGKANLMYRNLKMLRNICGHSVDYILYGVDDEIIKKTTIFLEDFSEEQLIEALNILKKLCILIKKGNT